MARLRGFKYTVAGYRRDDPVRSILLENENNYLTYIILSEMEGRSYIEKYQKGKTYRYDITDHIDAFYEEIKDLGIEKWDMRTYWSHMCWMPPLDYWTLEIHIEDISVMCNGEDAPPEGWKGFWKAFDRMCGKR